MLKRLRVLLTAWTAAMVTLVGSAIAQQAPDAPSGAARSHHEALHEAMRNMSRAMLDMTEDMSAAELPPDQRKSLAQRMERMASVMQRMSGMLARPAMAEPEFREQMAQMRDQMRDMTPRQLASPRTGSMDPTAEVERRMAEMETALDKGEVQIERIRRSSDAAEREKLVLDHAQAMRDNVRALRAIGEPYGRAMRSMMAGGNQNLSSEAMMKAHALIAQRIALMDRMMGQIMELLMRHQEIGSGK